MPNKKKSYVTANDLQKWIDHLTDDEKELPIAVSHIMFPQSDEILEIESIGSYMSQHYDGYIMLVKKNYEKFIKELGDD